MLLALGEDPERPELEDTPRRWASWLREFFEFDPGTTDIVFDHVGPDQIVTVSGMRVWSMCEHHMLPFWCDVSIGYVAHHQFLGLSKFARVAHQFAHRLQLQERLVHQIADEVQRLTRSPDVAVVAKGEHLCMTARGVRTSGQMSSAAMRGVFAQDAGRREEFFRMIG